METSLIGKALNFGFNEYGFESHVSNINFSYYASYLLNLVQIASLHKKITVTTVYSRRIFFLLKLLMRIQYINFFYIMEKKKNHPRAFCKICPFYYKTLSAFYRVKIVSKPSKSFFVSLRALRLFSLRARSSGTVLVVSTSRGLITHFDAIKLNLAGFVFAYFYI